MNCTKLLTLILLCGALATILGCHSQKSADFMPSEQEITPVDRGIAAQAAAGARDNATLYARDFDGAQLNSLGLSRLHLMTLAASSSSQPLVVYLNTAPRSGAAQNPAQLSQQRDAVRRYLQAAGIPADRIDLRDGPNPETFAPAAAGITALEKQRTAAWPGAATGYGAPAMSAAPSSEK
jgi:hypothetical protein